MDKAGEAQSSYGSGDEIMAEMRHIKDELGREYAGDIHRLFEDLRKAEVGSGRRVVDFSQK